MPNPGQELSSIDFASMIGGPLSAVVEAQAQSAITTVNFIREVGFEKDDDGNITKPIYIEFLYDKEVTADDGTIGTSKFKLSVPILTMLPIPFIRIDEATIEFNAKINTIQHYSQEIALGVDASLSASANYLFYKVKLNVSMSYQRKTNRSEDVKRTYSLKIYVKAVADDMPAGAEKVLGILENAISEAAA